jgi:hypothetical protein
LVTLVLSASHASTAEDVSLDNYSCAQFLDDSRHPSDGSKLAKSLMTIAWATGYAAAYHKNAPRADAEAIRLIAATLGTACRNAPDQRVIRVVADAITAFSKDETRPNISKEDADLRKAGWTQEQIDKMAPEIRARELGKIFR